MIQSKIQYGIAAWGAAYKTTLKPIIRCPKKFLKILYKKLHRYSSNKLFAETKVPTIYRKPIRNKNTELRKKTQSRHKYTTKR